MDDDIPVIIGSTEPIGRCVVTETCTACAVGWCFLELRESTENLESMGGQVRLCEQGATCRTIARKIPEMQGQFTSPMGSKFCATKGPPCKGYGRLSAHRKPLIGPVETLQFAYQPFSQLVVREGAERRFSFLESTGRGGRFANKDRFNHPGSFGRASSTVGHKLMNGPALTSRHLGRVGLL
jgi:hypothetical protein